MLSLSTPVFSNIYERLFIVIVIVLYGPVQGDTKIVRIWQGKLTLNEKIIPCSKEE